MNARALLVALLVLSTVGFVVGVSVEKSSADSHDEPAATTTGSGEGGEAQSGGGAESAEQHASEAAGEEAHSEPGSGETAEKGGEDATLLGVDLEATPFVALAAALSLALALAVWLRSGWGLLLGVVAVGLLAALVAALHLAAAGVALWLGRSSPASREATA